MDLRARIPGRSGWDCDLNVDLMRAVATPNNRWRGRETRVAAVAGRQCESAALMLALFGMLQPPVARLRHRTLRAPYLIKADSLLKNIEAYARYKATQRSMTRSARL